MTDLEKRAEKYCCYNFPTTHTENMVKACVEFAQSESALLSQHILDLQRDKGNLTDKVRKLEQQIKKMKSDVISERDEARRLEDVITYTVLNNILAKWGIKEND